MKKALVVILVLMGASSVCLADDCSMPVLVSAPDSSTVQTITGTVDSVSIADSLKGLRSEIVIGGSSGRRHVLIVKTTTTIYDPVWKPIGLEVLRKNDSVKVKFITTGEGLDEALSIKKLQQ
jgi:hypothetical protein